MATIPRPLPAGVNNHGLPLWDGGDLRRFREAHGVGEGFVARALPITLGALASTYENERRLVALPYDRVEKYLQAVERQAAYRDARAEKGLAELKARIKTRTVRS